MKIKLEDFENWKNLNKSNSSFSLYDYIYQKLTMKNLNSDLFFAFSEMFWPSFTTFNNKVFLTENFSEQKLKELSSQKDKEEFWINFLNLDPYFENDEDGEEKALQLANTLKDIWQIKLEKEFPQLNFSVEILEDKSTGDCGLTFYQGPVTQSKLDKTDNTVK